jgi:glutathione S-transferase
VLDEAFADRPYLLGNEFTVADLNVAAVISRAIDMDLSATPRLAPGSSAASSGRPRSRRGACAKSPTPPRRPTPSA